MSTDWKPILVAIATILSMLANAGVIRTSSVVNTLEARTNAHSLGRKARFERIERRLDEIQVGGPTAYGTDKAPCGIGSATKQEVTR